MQLFTTVPVQPQLFSFNYKTRFALFGSCFAENIGKRLQNYKLKTLMNPLGISYSPLSISNSFQRIFNKKQFAESDVHLLNEQWFSFHHHTKLNSLSKETHLSKLNTTIEQANQFLLNTNVLIVTFGTAYSYQLIETGEVVANCQKVPQQFFKKSRSSVKQIAEIYEVLLKQLFSLNDDLKVVFTVSPVRHIKDGIIENQKSKAVLLLAIDALTTRFKEKTSYFPAYEIMIDELRDYRFYDKDLLHPNETAIDYIWKQFCKSYLSEPTNTTLYKLDKLLQQVNHQPFNPYSAQHQTATKQLINRLQAFQQEHGINLNEEINVLSNQILTHE